MAKNPLYRNEYYFFSDMYDDSLITEFYRKISSESYDRSISYQQNMLGRKRHINDDNIFYKSTLGEFKVDDIYNSTVGLPNGSRTIKFDTLIIPYHNKRKYLSTYGLRYKKIPLIDFYTKSDIFDKSISIQIGRYRIMSAFLIENIDKTVTLAISNSNVEGITDSAFTKIINEYEKNEPVWIFSDEITKTYYYDTTATVSISNTATDGQYEIKVPKTAALNNISYNANKEITNSWDCLMTLSSSTYGKNILISTTCSFKGYSNSNGTEYAIFYVNEKFVNYVKKSGINIKLYFINHPNRKHLLVYEYNKTSSPIININYIDNPSGNINIDVFEIDLNTMCKGRKLYDPEFTQLYFPNIFDFSKLNVNKSNLIIEVTEYNSIYTNQKMQNSISPLIESLGSDFYTEYIVNEYDKSHDGTSLNLKEYYPKHFPISLDDYKSSEYYGDLRGYILDKISKTIESDPYLMNSYLEWIDRQNTKVISTSGTPKFLQMGTGQSGEFSGSNEIVMDTSSVATTQDDIYYFEEPHSYISYYSSGDKCPANIYINGKYIKPTCIKNYKGLNYLFFPIKIVNDELNRYSTDEELISASPIIVDFYPETYNSPIEVPTSLINIISITEKYKIFENYEDKKFSLNELSVYDNYTGKYLGELIDVFDIILNVSKYKIDNPGEENEILINKGEAPNYLYTVLNELYCTADNVPIIVGGDNISLSWNDFIDNLISDGVITEPEKYNFTHKKLDFSNIELVPKDGSYLGMNMVIFTKSFKDEREVKPSTGTYRTETNTTEYTVTKGTFDNDASRYYVFVNGTLDDTANVITSDTHGGDLVVILQGDHLNDENIIIVHMPINYQKINYRTTDKVFYMKKADTSETEPLKIWNSSISKDGIILQSLESGFTSCYAFESDKNMKFTESGFRLPHKTISTNRLFAQYYDGDRALSYNLHDNDNGFAYCVVSDIPFIALSKQNPYAISYNEKDVKNPLDVLTYIE